MELFKYPVQLVWLSAGFALLVFFHLKARAAAERAAAQLLDGRHLTMLAGRKALGRKRTRGLFHLAGLAFLVAAAGGPQWGMDMAPVTDVNGSLAVAVDTSLSMGAKDLKPSRMENAKLMLSALADKFQDYRIGVIAFSGDAYVQCPLTTDSDAVKYFLSYLSPGILPVPGTNLASAIREAGTMLGRTSGQKVLVLITDGENTEDGIDDALNAAEAEGLRIFTVGIGKPEGELIPEAGEDGKVSGYKKDRSGKTVVTRLDETALLKIAQRTGAEYIRYGGDPETAAGGIRATVSRLALAKSKGFGRSVYKNRYRIPLFIAFLLLLVELMFMEKGIVLPAAAGALLKRFRKAPAALLLAALSLSCVSPEGIKAASPESLARKGNGAYKKKDFPKAYDHYSKALEKDPGNSRIWFNRGAASYRMEEYEKAAEDSEAAGKEGEIKAAAAYNAGNAYFRLSDFAKAAAKYRESLLADPGYRDAAYNLQKALLELKKSEQQDKEQKEKKQDKKEQDREQNGRNGDKQEEDRKKKEEQRKKEAARKQADKLLELMKEKEKESGGRDMMNARFQDKPGQKERSSGKDW